MPTIKSHALTTVARVAQFLGISPDSAQTDVLINLINQATSLIERELGFRIKKTAYTNELADGDESGVITLKHRPVLSSQSITVQYRTSALNEDNWETVSSREYVVDYEAGQILGMGNYKFRGGRGLFRVSYTAGYDFDNLTTFLSDTDAGDLEYACWLLVQSGYDGGGAATSNSADVKSESIGDYSITYADTSASGSDGVSVNEILDRYRGLEIGAGLTPNHY